jgi:ribosomal protein L44E
MWYCPVCKELTCASTEGLELKGRQSSSAPTSKTRPGRKSRQGNERWLFGSKDKPFKTFVLVFGNLKEIPVLPYVTESFFLPLGGL